MTIIYHNRDLDGWCSGAIGKMKYPDAQMIGYDYGEPFDINVLPEGEPVIMVDVSMEMPMMLKIASRSNFQFTWVDHHISKMDEWEEYKKGMDEDIINAVLDNDISACRGMWRHLYPGIPEPTAVTLLGMYDIFDNKDKELWDREIFPFQYGMRCRCNSVESFPEEYLFRPNSVRSLSFIDKVIEEGRQILKYQDMQNEFLMKKSAFEFEIFPGLLAICCNVSATQYNSQTFASVYDRDRHKLMVPFGFQKSQWVISMYSDHDDVHCGELAKGMGGGGHKGAAGFQAKDISTIFPDINLDGYGEE